MVTFNTENYRPYIEYTKIEEHHTVGQEHSPTFRTVVTLTLNYGKWPVTFLISMT